MHHACSRLDDRHTRVLAHEVNQSASAAGNDQVHKSRGIEQLRRGIVCGRQKLRHIWVETLGLQHGLNELNDSLVAGFGTLTAFQQTCVSALEAEREDIESDVWARLIDDANNAKGNAHAAQTKAVGQGALFALQSQGRGQRGYVTHVAGYVLKTLGGELQTVVERVFGTHRLEVECICLENEIGMAGNGVRQREKHLVALLVGEGQQRARGKSCILKYLFHDFASNIVWGISVGLLIKSWSTLSRLPLAMITSMPSAVMLRAVAYLLVMPPRPALLLLA